MATVFGKQVVDKRPDKRVIIAKISPLRLCVNITMYMLHVGCSAVKTKVNVCVCINDKLHIVWCEMWFWGGKLQEFTCSYDSGDDEGRFTGQDPDRHPTEEESSDK